MAISVRTDIADLLGVARMQNGVKTVRSVVLKNNSGEELKDVKVQISTDPEFAHNVERTVGCLPDKSRLVISDLDLSLSLSYLANLTEPLKGTISIQVTAAKGDTKGDAKETVASGPARETVASEVKEVRLLPYDHWEGVSHMPELLASYILPNHPTVKDIVSSASETLKKTSSDPSVGGYINASPKRVLLEMEAIYRAISTYGIAYGNVPASFHETGQRVRMPEEILSNRIATCLDSALLYAACLEAVGIHPVIVFTAGHAFAGGWLSPTSHPYAVCDDVTTLSKHMADGINDLVLVETTGSDSGNGMTFSEAVNTGKSNLSNPDDFVCMIDIEAARQFGIRPLPLRVQTPAGYEIQLQEEQTVDKGDDILPTKDLIDLDAPPKTGKHTIWERKLLDLTLKNNLLNIHTTSSCVQLMNAENQHISNILGNDGSFRIYGIPDNGLAGTLLKKGIMAPSPTNDTMYKYAMSGVASSRLHTYMDEEETARRINALRKAARSALEESGANTLFLTIGSLRWFDEEGKGPFIAPVILYPVELSGTDNRLTATDDEPMVNMTLLEMLRQKFGITVPGLEDVVNDGHVNVRQVLNTMRMLLMNRKGWDIDDLLFLGNFNFSKFIIWNDIHTHRDMLDTNPVVSSLVQGKLNIQDLDPGTEGQALDEACCRDNILFPISADSSQMKAVFDAVHGRSFVMHGPPGTGKSQTITNIIANALYQGKRVLFVSEKMAALEVVQSRLEALGLDPFCLELHSNKTRKSVTMKKLEGTLSVAGSKGVKDFEQAMADELAFKKELNAHVNSLHGETSCGLTLYDCLSNYIAMGKGAEGRFPASVLPSLDTSRIQAMKDALGDYEMAIRHSHIDGHCQLIDMPMAEYTPEYIKELGRMLTEVISAKGFIKPRLAQKRLESFMGIPVGAGFSPSKTDAVSAKARRWLDALSQARGYAIYAKYRNALRTIGLGFIADAYERGDVKPDALDDYFHRSLYHSCAEFTLAKESGLNLFCSDIFESRVQRFRDFEERFRELSRKAIFAKAASRIPVAGDSKGYGNEMNVLLRAIRNGCRGISLRKFFTMIPNLLPRLCPCMLMSPLSVSQYLQSLNDQFDLLIFDEASQMPTSEAVASIARAKEVIVVGDANQLPPTSFFETSFFDEENAEIEDQDSILEECLAIPLPSNHLKWHYRSRHESLIAFSNANYYQNSLLTFPSNDDLRSMVTFQKVDGTYDRGRSRQNAAEAEAVVKDIKRRLSDPELKNQTIGVVTFNVTQQEAIETRLEEMFKRNSILKKTANELPEPIFIKNLESVQGDERDVILFSVGYGADAKGRIPMNFGPLNQANGWRRLNVAISRARLEMKVFSSILPEQMPASGLSRGVADLRAFLEYAINGRSALEVFNGESRKEDRFVEKLARELRQKGNTVNTHIGSSDFRIDIGIVDPSDPNRYIKGIIVDGPDYASARTAGDREVIRPEVLTGLGWNLERKWILNSYGK